MTVHRFEDLVAWQKARILTRELHLLCASPGMRKEPALVQQLKRSAISISANIAEGFDRQGHAEFRQFLSIAKGSSAEVLSLLYLVSDLELSSSDRLARLFRMAREVNLVIGALRRSLRSTDPAKSRAAKT